MLARKHQHPRTTACNDNGFIPMRRDARAPLPTILRVATETAGPIEAAGPISLSYLADGVLIITRA
jgi:hypothetical protein